MLLPAGARGALYLAELLLNWGGRGELGADPRGLWGERP